MADSLRMEPTAKQTYVDDDSWPTGSIQPDGIVCGNPRLNTMSNERKVYPEQQPDRGAIVVRGVCGALLGLAAAVVIWMRSGGFGLWGSVALFAASVIVCTLGSIHHGDSFWYGLLRRRG